MLESPTVKPVMFPMRFRYEIVSNMLFRRMFGRNQNNGTSQASRLERGGGTLPPSRNHELHHRNSCLTKLALDHDHTTHQPSVTAITQIPLPVLATVNSIFSLGSRVPYPDGPTQQHRQDGARSDDASVWQEQTTWLENLH